MLLALHPATYITSANLGADPHPELADTTRLAPATSKELPSITLLQRPIQHSATSAFSLILLHLLQAMPPSLLPHPPLCYSHDRLAIQPPTKHRHDQVPTTNTIQDYRCQHSAHRYHHQNLADFRHDSGMAHNLHKLGCNSPTIYPHGSPHLQAAPVSKSSFFSKFATLR